MPVVYTRESCNTHEDEGRKPLIKYSYLWYDTKYHTATIDSVSVFHLSSSPQVLSAVCSLNYSSSSINMSALYWYEDFSSCLSVLHAAPDCCASYFASTLLLLLLSAAAMRGR